MAFKTIADSSEKEFDRKLNRFVKENEDTIEEVTFDTTKSYLVAFIRYSVDEDES